MTTHTTTAVDLAGASFQPEDPRMPFAQAVALGTAHRPARRLERPAPVKPW